MKPLRCAVYTRKSTEDGLEQEFNSLDAQREACEAYVLSQRQEGWTLVPNRYDDGGFSGGNMERPGLKALLADVDAGQVDVIVVYKVDRLTRSLADFAKIVERLDAKEASFVSVTQAFNTTTSMGRLTLNVLLSFAQFEREVTGERIRDKIAASKKKGIWMGGPVPLGYQVIERKLQPVPEEADRVRMIMRRYLDPPAIRFQRGQLEQHLATHVGRLLNDEHAMRGLSRIEEAGALRTMFASAHLLSKQVREVGSCEQALRSLIAAIAIRSDAIAIEIDPASVGIDQQLSWNWSIPLPERRPFREARITIEDGARKDGRSNDLMDLVADAMGAQKLVLSSPELSLAQLAREEGRCRTQLTKLLRLSFLSPKIIEAIADGTQPKGLTRRVLLSCDLPVNWAEQERLFGLAA